MKQLQQTEVLGGIFPVAIKDDAAWVSQVIDVSEADYAEVAAMIGATDIAVAVMKIMESDTKTNETTLSGSPTEVMDVTTKPGAADDNKVWVLGVNCRGARKKFIQLQMTAGDGTGGTFAAAIWRVITSGVTSSLAADRGVEQAQYA